MYNFYEDKNQENIEGALKQTVVEVGRAPDSELRRAKVRRSSSVSGFLSKNFDKD